MTNISGADSNPICRKTPSEEQADTALNLLAAAPIVILSIYIGIGLLLKKRSARAWAILSSLFTVAFWLRRILFSWALQDIDQTIFTSTQTKSNIILALFLNGVIFLYMVYGNDVAHAFGEKE
jgi:hypothetical protein